jgi:hypothetical protein
MASRCGTVNVPPLPPPSVPTDSVVFLFDCRSLDVDIDATVGAIWAWIGGGVDKV